MPIRRGGAPSVPQGDAGVSAPRVRADPYVDSLGIEGVNPSGRFALMLAGAMAPTNFLMRIPAAKRAWRHRYGSVLRDGQPDRRPGPQPWHAVDGNQPFKIGENMAARPVRSFTGPGVRAHQYTPQCDTVYQRPIPWCPAGEQVLRPDLSPGRSPYEYPLQRGIRCRSAGNPTGAQRAWDFAPIAGDDGGD